MKLAHLQWLQVPEGAFVESDPNGDDHTGVYSWPAGDRFARDFADIIDCNGLRVLDIGCGRGHLGFSALTFQAASVVFADGNKGVRDGVEVVIAANALADRVSVIAHAWGDPVPGGPFDLVLGGDVLYRAALFPALIASMAGALAPQGSIVLSDPRYQLEPELPQIAADHGLSWTTTRRSDVTIATLRRLSVS